MNFLSSIIEVRNASQSNVQKLSIIPMSTEHTTPNTCNDLRYDQSVCPRVPPNAAIKHTNTTYDTQPIEH